MKYQKDFWLNWVELRSKCNAQQMFLCLADRLQRDIEEWEKLPARPVQGYVKIATRETSALYLTWNAAWPRQHSRNGTYAIEVVDNSITFRQLDSSYNSTASETIIPTLNKEGQCVF